MECTAAVPKLPSASTSASSEAAALSIFKHRMVYVLDQKPDPRLPDTYCWRQKYTLAHLINTPVSNEESTRVWIENHCLPGGNQSSISVNKCTMMPELCRFAPFNSSVDIHVRPDVSVVLEKNHQGETLKFSLVTVQVCSGMFRGTVAKAVINGIEQLRIIRAVYPFVDRCVSYAFPNHVENGVIQVTVEFSNLNFKISVNVLEKVEVCLNIKGEVARILRTIRTGRGINDAEGLYPYYVRLDQRDCNEVCQQSKQVATKHSILLRSSDQSRYLKFCPSPTEHFIQLRTRTIVWFEAGRPSLFHYSLLPMRDLITFPHLPLKHLQFFEFDSLRGPLTSLQCKSCLCLVIEGVKQVLDELHHQGTAHMDVRLPNVCFRPDDTVVLIDLDRCEYADNCSSVSYKDSDMYNDSWVCARWIGGLWEC